MVFGILYVGFLECLVPYWVGGAMAPSVFEEVIGCSGTELPYRMTVLAEA